MARSLSNTMIGAMFAQETGEIPLILIEISHDDMTTLRYVNNTEDVVSNGETYTARSFEISIPPVDSDNEIPKTPLTMENVDLLSHTFRGLSTSPTVKVGIILQSAPDNIEPGWLEFTWNDLSWNELVITGSLGYEDILDELFPAGRF